MKPPVAIPPVAIFLSFSHGSFPRRSWILALHSPSCRLWQDEQFEKHVGGSIVVGDPQ